MSEVAINTNRELWREREGDYYADSIFVTRDNAGIGMNCGGSVIVMPVRAWHALGVAAPSLPVSVNGEAERAVLEIRYHSAMPNWVKLPGLEIRAVHECEGGGFMVRKDQAEAIRNAILTRAISTESR